MMSKRTPWVTTKTLPLRTRLQEQASWQQAVADGQITPEEVRLQAEKVIALLQTVQPRLSQEQKAQVTRIFYEMAVFQAMQTLQLTQDNS